METLAMDGSTLPALKDLFPEHFFEHPEQGANASQVGGVLPHMPDSMLQLPHPPQAGTQHQDAQFQFGSAVQNDVYAQQMAMSGGPVHGGRRPAKQERDDVRTNVQAQPQSQYPDPYFPAMGAGQPGHPYSNPMNIHARVPDSVHSYEDLGGDEGETLEEGDGPDDGEKRRHPCPRCGKRFNRPSSLKIHLNTHTGAKPYACPFQGCGRTFNVSSNMRRHFRNHARRPPPPPLPQNTGYSVPEPSFQQAPLRRGRPAKYNPDPHQQNSFLPSPYDNGSGFAGSSNHATQLYPPSSDVRNSGNGREDKRAPGALMTPPYTAEGSDYDQDKRGFHSQVPSYDSFAPAPGHLSQSIGFPGPQSGVIPMGMLGMGPSGMFPFDPALVGGENGMGANDGADADADGELDPDRDLHADEKRTNENGEPGRLRPSTSNTRGPLEPKGPRQQRPSYPQANDIVNVPAVVPFPSLSGTHSARASVHSGAEETQYREVLVPVPANVADDPAQVAQYVHQYQMRYVQQVQEYQQHQQSNVLPQSGYVLPFVSQKDPRTGVGNHDGEGAAQFADVLARALPQSNARATRNVLSDESSEKARGESINNDANGAISNVTPGAAPAPPYKLYSYPPPKISEVGKTQADLDDSNVLDDEGSDDNPEDDDNDDDDDDDDDDDEYTGKSPSKKGKRGRPRGRPKGSTRGSGRGRGRPRKSAVLAVTENEVAPVPESDTHHAEEEGGRTTRKRRRVSTRGA